MEMVVWQHEGPMVGNTLLAMSGDALYEFIRTGDSSRREILDIAAALEKGQPPEFSRPGDVVRLAAIRRIEVAPDRPTVKFYHDAEGKPRSLEYRVRDRGVATEIARAVVDRAGLSPVERLEDISVPEVLEAPFVLVALAAGGLLLALIVSYALLGSPNTPTFRGGPGKEGEGPRWYHWLVFLIPVALILLLVVAAWLPTRAWYALGAVVLGAMTLWTAWRVVRRPQKLVWGGPIKA